MAAWTYPMIDPVIFAVGPFAVRWYGLAYVLGFIAGGYAIHVFNRRWRVGLSDDEVLSAFLWGSIGLIVGARLGYMVFYAPGQFISDPTSLFRTTEGGMSFHGGLAGIVVAGLLFARRVGIPFLRIADMVAVGAPIGILLGRLANFINGELWGRVTEVPWGMVFPGAGPLPRHPSQLYEAALEGAVLFVVMVVLARRERPPGEMLGWLLSGYGVIRFALEFVREPDAHLGTILGPLSMGQLLTIPVLMVGVWLVARVRSQPGAGPDRRPD